MINIFSNVNIFIFIMIGNRKILKQIEIIRKNKEIKIKKKKSNISFFDKVGPGQTTYIT